MIWKLTPQIWWGNAKSTLENSGARSWICLADNLADLPRSEHDPCHSSLENALYFRLPHDENQEVESSYLEVLFNLFDEVIFNYDGFPLIIYCRAGQVRSPITAVIMAARLTSEPVRHWLDRARELRPDIDLTKAYPASILELSKDFLLTGR